MKDTSKTGDCERGLEYGSRLNPFVFPLLIRYFCVMGAIIYCLIYKQIMIKGFKKDEVQTWC